MGDMPPAQKITDEDIVDVLHDPGHRPVMTASDIADVLGVVSETIRGRMDGVVAEYSEVRCSKIDRANVYWVEGAAPTDPSDSGSPPKPAQVERPTDSDPGEPEVPEPEPETQPSAGEEPQDGGGFVADLLRDMTSDMATLTVLATVVLLIEAFAADVPFVGLFLLSLTVFSGVVGTGGMYLLARRVGEADG